jgi:hypothetical protein
MREVVYEVNTYGTVDDRPVGKPYSGATLWVPNYKIPDEMGEDTQLQLFTRLYGSLRFNEKTRWKEAMAHVLGTQRTEKNPSERLYERSEIREAHAEAAGSESPALQPPIAKRHDRTG